MFFLRLPTAILVPLYFIKAFVQLIYRILTRTLIGFLFLVGTAYFYLIFCGEVKPYGGLDLLLWVNSLEKEYKVALLSSSVTILGFIIAFHTATTSWRSQMISKLQLESSVEIEDIITKISRDIVQARIYAEGVINAYNIAISDNSKNRDVAWEIDYTKRQTPSFEETRNRLSFYGLEVERLKGKYYQLLAGKFGAIESFQSTINALNSILARMWVPSPYFEDDSSPLYIEKFKETVREKEWREFIKVCNEEYTTINIYAGVVKGLLLSSVIDTNISTYWHAFSMKKIFRDVFDDLKRTKARNTQPQKSEKAHHCNHKSSG